VAEVGVRGAGGDDEEVVGEVGPVGEAQPAPVGLDGGDLAEQILVSCSGAGSCAGGYIDRASDFIRDTGLPDESVYPYAATDGIIIAMASAVLPRHLLDSVPRGRLRQAAWQERPVGNGPFRFVRHEANRRWVFERNPDFPGPLGGPPVLERLVIAVVDEPMTKLAALTSGELDFAGIQPAHAQFVARDPLLEVRDYPLLFTTGIVFNTRRRPFDSLPRRAQVASSLDRPALVAGFAYGFGTPADGPVPPELTALSAASRVPGTGCTDGPCQQRARPMLPPVTGPPLSFELLTVGSGEAALEQMVQAQLARAGITVKIRQLELSAFLDRVYGPHPDFEAALLGTPGDLGLGYLKPLASLSGLRPPDGPEALQRFFHDSLPATFLYHSRGLQGVSRRVRGVQLGLRGELASVATWSVQ